MTRTTSHNILLTVSAPSGTQPSWVLAVPVGSWGTIPNSTMITATHDYAQALGYPAPVNNFFSWGANKYGANFVGSQYDPIGINIPRLNFCGSAFDRRDSSWWASGNFYWADNSYHKLSLEFDTPVWTLMAVRGVDNPPQGAAWEPNNQKLYLKKPINKDNQNTYPVTVAPDDDRFDRYYDGGWRPGHTYWFQQLIENRNYICHFGTAQYYPVDYGSTDRVIVADMAIGKWKFVEEIPSPAGGGLGQVIAQQIVKDYLTEDVYIWRTLTGLLRRWRWNVGSAGGQWENVYSFFGLGGFFSQGILQDLAMCVHPTQRYVLCVGQMGNTAAGVMRFIIDMNQSDPGNPLGKYIPVTMTGNASDVAVTYSASSNTVTMAQARPIAFPATVRFYGASVTAAGGADVNGGTTYFWNRVTATTGTLSKRDPNINTIIPVTIAADGAGTMTRLNYTHSHPIEWCPDALGGCMLGFQDDSMVYAFTKTGPSTINVDEYPTVNAPTFHSPTQASAFRGGGVLTGWKYAPRLKSFVYFMDDSVPLGFLRIA